MSPLNRASTSPGGSHDTSGLKAAESQASPPISGPSLSYQSGGAKIPLLELDEAVVLALWARKFPHARLAELRRLVRTLAEAVARRGVPFEDSFIVVAGAMLHSLNAHGLFELKDTAERTWELEDPEKGAAAIRGVAGSVAEKLDPRKLGPHVDRLLQPSEGAPEPVHATTQLHGPHHGFGAPVAMKAHPPAVARPAAAGVPVVGLQDHAPVVAPPAARGEVIFGQPASPRPARSLSPQFGA